MARKSNRYLKYCGRNEFLDLSYTKYAFHSSCSYKFLVSIVYATGIMDVISSCLLIYACSWVLDMLKELENFNRLFPTYTATFTKLFTDVTLSVFGLDNEGVNVQEYEDMMLGGVLILKISSVHLLGVALFFLILSGLLFVGIYKKNSTCCFIWNACLCMTMIIYFVLALVVSAFNLFKLNPRDWVMICTYGFYRFATIVAVYRFQRKFLFISQVNGHTAMYSHQD